MHKFHPFYIIGTFGMMIVGILHILLSLGLSISAHSTFFTLYSLFFSFLIIGLSLTIKGQKLRKERQ